MSDTPAAQHIRQMHEFIAENRRLIEALKLIEDHHAETEEWRDIARAAIQECGK
jgi:hypothetical protein